MVGLASEVIRMADERQPAETRGLTAGDETSRGDAGHLMANEPVRYLVLASKAAGLFLLAVIPLMLACEVGPTKTSRPPADTNQAVSGRTDKSLRRGIQSWPPTDSMETLCWSTASSTR